MDDNAKKQAKIADLKAKYETLSELVSKIMSSLNKSMEESSYDSQVVSIYYMVLGAMFSPPVGKEVQETVLEEIANLIAENQ